MNEANPILGVGAIERAMERGAEAFRAGLPCVPPDSELILLKTSWMRGWEHARDEAREGDAA